MKSKNKPTKAEIWISIHQVCGDCGKRIKVKIDLEKIDLKSLLKTIKLYYEKYNMACSKCSNDKYSGIKTKKEVKKHEIRRARVPRRPGRG